MSHIIIPFSREMAIAAIEGRKIATTRSEPKGEIGDTFDIWHPDVPRNEACKYFGLPKFRILDIITEELPFIRDVYFRLEGFETRGEFEKTWRSLHRGHFTINKDYYIHFFVRVK